MGLRGKASMLDSHPQKPRILRELLDPRITDNVMAERYGVSKGTIQKWKIRTKHLLHLSRANATESTRDELINDVMELHNENKAMLEIAKEKKDVKGGAAVLQAMLGTVRLKGETMGVLGQKDNSPSQPNGVNIQMLIGMPHTGPMREGEEDGPGPAVDIVSEKVSDNYYE